MAQKLSQIDGVAAIFISGAAGLPFASRSIRARSRT